MPSSTVLALAALLLCATASFGQADSTAADTTTRVREVCFTVPEAQVVLDSLNMLPVWVRLNRIAVANAANERNIREKADARAGAEAAKALKEASRADRAEADYKRASDKLFVAETKLSGRFWLGFGVGVGLTGVGLGAAAMLIK